MSCMPTDVSQYAVAELELHGLDQRSLDALDYWGIVWLHQLLQCEKEQLIDIPGIGEKNFRTIMDSVHNHREAYGW